MEMQYTLPIITPANPMGQAGMPRPVAGASQTLVAEASLSQAPNQSTPCIDAITPDLGAGLHVAPSAAALQIAPPGVAGGFRLHHTGGAQTLHSRDEFFDIFAQQQLAETFEDRLRKGQPVLLCRLTGEVTSSQPSAYSNWYDTVALKSLFQVDPRDRDPCNRQNIVAAHFFAGLPAVSTTGQIVELSAFAQPELALFELGNHAMFGDPLCKNAAEFLEAFAYQAKQEVPDPRVYYYLALLIEAGLGHPAWATCGIGQKLKMYAVALSYEYYLETKDFLAAVSVYCTERTPFLSEPEVYAVRFADALASHARRVATVSLV